MPDAPQPASKKRKAVPAAPSSSATPVPKKKPRTDSGRAPSSKSVETKAQLTTPSVRGFVRPNSPASAPPRTKSHRPPTQGNVVAESSTQVPPPPRRRRTRSTVTVSSRKRVDSPDLDDDTPPPVTALRRSSSGRIITSTPKVTAANDLGKLFGSAKPRSRQKRKLSPATPDIIELYSSGEEEWQRGMKGKLPEKRRKKRKATDVIDLCSDDEPSPSPARKSTVRTRVDDNIVTILSSDDDKTPTRPIYDDELRASQRFKASLKKGKGRSEAALGAPTDDAPLLAAASSSVAQSSAQLSNSVAPTPPCPSAATADDQTSGPVIGNLDNLESTKIRHENTLIKPSTVFIPLFEHIHVDEEFQGPVPQSLNENNVNHSAAPSTYHDPPDTNTSPSPTEPLSISGMPCVTVPISETNSQVEISKDDDLGNASLEQLHENQDGVSPARNTTPLFLPDEEQEAEAEGVVYASHHTTPPGDIMNAKLPDAAPSPLTGRTRETDLGDDSPKIMYRSSIQSNGGNVPEFKPIETSTEPQPGNALSSLMSGSKLMVANTEDISSQQRTEGENVEEDYPQEESSSMSPKDCKTKHVSFPKESADDDSREAKDTELHNPTLHPSVSESDGIEQTGGVIPTDDSTTDPQLTRLLSPGAIGGGNFESLPSTMPYQQLLEKAYAEEVLRSRYQILHRTPSYVDHNIVYPSDPSTLLAHLRLHTPGFFSQSFILPSAVKEKGTSVEDRQGRKDVFITQPTIVTQGPSSGPTTVEIFTASSQPVNDVEIPIVDIAMNEAVPASSSPASSSQDQEEAQVDALLLEQEAHSDSTPTLLSSEGGDEVVMEVTAEFLENDPTLAPALLESKMFMDILRDVQQESPEAQKSDEQTKISDELTHSPTEAPDEPVRDLHDPNHFPHKSPPGSTEAQTKMSFVSEPVKNDNEQPSTPKPAIHPGHGSPPSPSSLNSSGTLPLPPTPKGEECVVDDPDIFFIRSESPSVFNPGAFAAILDMTSPPPLAKEEDDYFSTHFFDYPDDIVV